MRVACGFAFAAWLAASAAAQSVPVYVPDANPAGGNCNAIPFGAATTTPACTYACRIPASYLSASRPVINEIFFAPCGSGTFQCPSIQMGIGHVPSPLPGAGFFPAIAISGNVASLGTFLDYTPIWNSVALGPFVWSYTQDAWSPLGVGALGAAPFVWNGVNDIAFFVTWSGAIGLGTFHATTTEPYAVWSSGVFRAPAPALSGATGLKLLLNCAPRTYQINQTGASLDLNGVATTGAVPATVIATANSVCTFGTVTVHWSSSFAGNPFDVGLVNGVLVPSTGGGFVTAGGNIANLILSDPSLAFLFGLAYVTPFSNATFAFTPPAIPYAASAQMLVLDGGTSIDGFRLSQGVRYSVTPASTLIPSPTGDDAFLTYTLGTGPLCATGPTMPFYGASYSQIAVSTNGRIMWNGGDLGYYSTPAAATANPGMAGAWCDLYVGLPNGHVAVSLPGPGVFRADWVGVPYFPGVGSTTFGVQVDAATGSVQIDGLVFSSPGNQMLIGISRGQGASAGVTTDFATFIGLGLQNGPGGSAMIYKIGGAGSLVPGCGIILFTPNGTGNYNFTVF